MKECVVDADHRARSRTDSWELKLAIVIRLDSSPITEMPHRRAPDPQSAAATARPAASRIRPAARPARRLHRRPAPADCRQGCSVRRPGQRPATCRPLPPAAVAVIDELLGLCHGEARAEPGHRHVRERHLAGAGDPARHLRRRKGEMSRPRDVRQLTDPERASARRFSGSRRCCVRIRNRRRSRSARDHRPSRAACSAQLLERRSSGFPSGRSCSRSPYPRRRARRVQSGQSASRQ